MTHIGAYRHVVLTTPGPLDYGVGGSGLLSGPFGLNQLEFDGAGFDFTYPVTGEQLRVKDTVTAANNYRGAAQGKLTYTSPSVKWTRRSDGLLAATNGTTELPYEWDPSGIPLGLLAEEARTNLSLQSQTLSNAYWQMRNGGTITADTLAAPDGTTTSDNLSELNSTDGFGNVSGSPITVTSGVNYTFSVFAKRNNHDWFRITFANDISGTNRGQAWFNLATGAIGVGSSVGSGWTYVSHSIVAYGNGFYRCILTTTTGATTAYMNIISASADNSTTRADVGSGAGVGAKHDCWGCQVELGSFATSYIPTVAATVTRAVDNIFILLSALPFSATAGSVVVKHRAGAAGAGGNVFTCIHDNVAGQEIIYIYNNASSNTGMLLIDNNVTQASLNAGTQVFNVDNKLAVAWTANDFAASFNAGTIAADTAGTLPTLTHFQIGGQRTGTTTGVQWIEQIAYIKRRMVDAELQAVTRLL